MMTRIPQRLGALTAMVTVSVLLASCSLAPDYKTPQVSVPAHFKEEAMNPNAPLDLKAQWSEAKPAAAQPRGPWWEMFNDRELSLLIIDATNSNQNLTAMAARVEQARQTAVIEGAALFPMINGEAAAQRSQASAAGTGIPGPFKPETVYRAGLGLSYELDLFGRVRNTRAAAAANTAAVASDFNSMLLTLQSDVAQLYFTIRGQDAEIKLLRQTLALRQDGLKILEKRRDVGTVTDLEVSQNVVDLENTRAALEQLESERSRNENALAVLLGRAPAEFTLAQQPLSAQAPKVPAGLPSTLLERRPDIAAAQYNLMAANARIGIARAAFFPSLSLTASGGFASESLGSLFDWSSRTWAIGPLLTLPIFQGGRIVAENERTKAVYAENVAIYRQQVLTAFQDVEDTLSRLKMRDAQAQSFGRAKAAADRAARIAALRFESGDTGYLEEIEAKQSALAAGRAVIQTQTGKMVDTVQLVRALGGDFTAEFGGLRPTPDSAPAQKSQ